MLNYVTDTYGIGTLILLYAGHALADYPMEGDFLTQGRTRVSPEIHLYWIHTLTAHSAIHGVLVMLSTGSWLLGLGEFICHWIIDYFKYNGKITVNTDQSLHIFCKLIWWGACFTNIPLYT